MRRGWYSDKYFENIGRMLTALASEGYTYSGQHHNLPPDISPDDIAVGDIEVEMQWFTRRVGNTIVVGVDKALEMLRHCTGYWKAINLSTHRTNWKCGQSTMGQLSNRMATR